MNRHVRNHVRHMFYNDYNRRHPKRNTNYRNSNKYNKSNQEFSDLFIGIATAFFTIAVLVCMACN